VGERRIALLHGLSPRQADLLLTGGVINWLRQRLAATAKET
jgi:aconitate hydratase